MTDANVKEIGADLERVVEAVQDSVTDDMVGRLAETTAGSLDLLDRINRSGIGEAIPTLAAMANNGDLERLAGLARVLTTAEEAVTDDIVGRIAETAGGGLDLLDKVNRSGLDRALPVLVKMVDNGDLERVAELARLVTAAEDAVTDDIVGRFGETIGGALTLVDQVSRSRLAEALPVIDTLVENGDLRRVADLVRLVGAAEDAINDDMVGRLADMAGEAISVVDRLNRSGVGRLVEVLEKLDATGGLDIIADTLPKATEQLSLLRDMGSCFVHAKEEVQATPTASGGIFGLLSMLRDKENQEFIRFVMAFGRQLRERCVEQK